ncbi:hypothetical protein CDL15_Pgr028149 [Punica granatum]|uniref:DDB1- and CUL4-associated factor 8 n=1 Tax=Punica granatum TaxID=22663 RepID=A0A218XGR8_PUNGR|nr:hypothetical protein CDL15_Pgr028149 [Punica granatum]
MGNLRRRGSTDAFTEIYRRETGPSHPGRFAHRLSAAEVLYCRSSLSVFLMYLSYGQVLVERLALHARLNGHEECVNTIEFNSAGDILVSGSDDGKIVFWNWLAKMKKFSYNSGHLENVFQAKIMPFSNDRAIVTSSADGEVRLGQVLEGGHVDTRCLGNHVGAVHKLDVEPGSPYIFYSCGEDGFVRRFDLRSNSATTLFSCSSLYENARHREDVVMLNAIVIDTRNPYYFALGGSDEFARLYDIRRCKRSASTNVDKPVDLFCPPHLVDIDNIQITGLAFSKSSELLVSYNDELIYLFQKNMGLGPSPPSVPPEIEQQEEPQVYRGHRNSRTIKGVSFFGPHDEYVASGSDSGHVFIWKKRGGKLVRLMVGDRHVVNQVEPHPHMPFLATCGIDDTVKVWVPSEIDDCPLPKNLNEIMDTNKYGREDHFRMTLSPDVAMHILRLQERQSRAFTERRVERADVDFEEEDVEAYALGLLNDDPTGDGGSTATGGQNNCCIC